MDNYDNWKLSTPPTDEENECAMCGGGYHSNSWGSYCSKECWMADK